MLIVSIGTAVQASIGFGLSMIAAPLLLLIDPALVPAPLILIALLLSLWMAWQDRQAINLGNFKAAIAGRLLGTPPAALLLGSISATTFDLVFSLLVLLAVALSLVHSTLQATPRNVFFATALSGFMGTISSVGGPPIALVYQNASGADLRANLAVLFVLGTTMSLVALALVGRFDSSDVLITAWLFGGVVLGVLLSGPLKQRLDRTTARPWLLCLCFISAAGVLSRALYSLWQQVQ